MRAYDPLKGFVVAICVVHGLMTMHHASAQQGVNNLWMGGYEEESGAPWGGSDLDFYTGGIVISMEARSIDFYKTNSNIADIGGQLLFSTNGVHIV